MVLNPKIRPLAELADLLGKQRRGKKVVHCHGVFDPLHVGHIRYLNQAQQLGDILIVTVTPDHFVKKGPHRPAFPESLREEAIAALEGVDYVAVNEWPTAVETIKLLRPDFYVKGSEFRDLEDVTGAITQEKEAVESIGGVIAFTDDITFSASNIVNQHLPVFPQETREYLADFGDRFKLDDIVDCLEQARLLRVLAIGEAIIDEYCYCDAIGKSGKEPTLVVQQASVERHAGGVLAVGNHVAGFCDTVGIITALGTEQSHEDFVRCHLLDNVNPLFLYQEGAPTIVKRRFIEQYFLTRMFEVYEMRSGQLTPAENEQLCSFLKTHVAEYDVVIVADFGHGLLSEAGVEILSDNARFLALSAQSNAGNFGYHTISKYHRADYISIAENELRLETRNRHGDLRNIIPDVSQKLNCGRISVTRGKHGCLAYSDSEGLFEVPAFAGQVVDRVGAGDAFFAVTALCVARNAPMEMVGFVGNAVGAQAVATVGNRTPIENVALVRQMAALLK